MPFKLSNIRSHDRLALSRAEQFLLQNPDSGVRIRPDVEIARAVDTGLALILSDDDAIIGLSLIYPYRLTEDGPYYSEIGTMRIIVNGMGLQDFIAKFHLLQLRLEEWGENIPNVFAVVTPGTASEHVLKVHVDMVPWAPPADLQAGRKAAGVPFYPQKCVVHAENTSFTRAKADLLAWHIGQNKFRTPKGAGEIEVDLPWFDPNVLALEI